MNGSTKNCLLRTSIGWRQNDDGLLEKVWTDPQVDHDDPSLGTVLGSDLDLVAPQALGEHVPAAQLALPEHVPVVSISCRAHPVRRDVNGPRILQLEHDAALAGAQPGQTRLGPPPGGLHEHGDSDPDADAHATVRRGSLRRR